jgi:hypothetical protein
MTPSLRPAVQLRHRKISRCLAEDLVRLKQLAVLPLSAFILSATSVGTPARLPLSTSAFLTHSFSVCAEQPMFAEIDMIACQRELCWPWLSSANRTARSRTSGEYLFVVLLIVASSYSGVEASGKPGAVQGERILRKLQRPVQG